MKEYNIWIEVEEHDTETDEYRNLCKTGEVEPVKMGRVKTLERAVELAKSHDLTVWEVA